MSHTKENSDENIPVKQKEESNEIIKTEEPLNKNFKGLEEFATSNEDEIEFPGMPKDITTQPNNNQNENPIPYKSYT